MCLLLYGTDVCFQAAICETDAGGVWKVGQSHSPGSPPNVQLKICKKWAKNTFSNFPTFSMQSTLVVYIEFHCFTGEETKAEMTCLLPLQELIQGSNFRVPWSQSYV